MKRDNTYPLECRILNRACTWFNRLGWHVFDVHTQPKLDLSGYYWEFEHYTGFRWWLRNRLMRFAGYLNRESNWAYYRAKQNPEPPDCVRACRKRAFSWAGPFVT